MKYFVKSLDDLERGVKQALKGAVDPLPPKDIEMLEEFLDIISSLRMQAIEGQDCAEDVIKLFQLVNQFFFSIDRS